MQQRRMFSSDNSANNSNEPIGTSDYPRNHSEPGQESLNLSDDVLEEEEEEGDGDSVAEAVNFDELEECLDELIRDPL